MARARSSAHCLPHRFRAIFSTELDVGPLYVPLDLDKAKNGKLKTKKPEAKPVVKFSFFGSGSTRTQDMFQTLEQRAKAPDVAAGPQRRRVAAARPSSGAAARPTLSTSTCMTSVMAEAMEAASLGAGQATLTIHW